MPNKNVTLRLGNYIRLTVVHVSQGDTSLTWVFQIVDESGNVYAPAVRYAILAGNKPDGHAFAYLCTKVGDTYQLPPSAYNVQMTAAAGLVTAELRLIDNSGRSIGTCNFTIDVEEGPEGAVTVASDSSLPAYLTILQELGVLVGKVETLPDDVPGWIGDWLEEHISGGQGVAVDNTLTVQGAAADAKAVGDAIKNNLASEYDPTLNYAAGNYVVHDNKLYRARAEITPEAWNEAHWVRVSLAERIGELEHAQIETDTTLTVAGAAADAKAVGDVLGVGSFTLGTPEDWRRQTIRAGAREDSTKIIAMAGFLPRSVTHVTCADGYASLIYRYTAGGEYVGFWKDNDFANSGSGTFRQEFDVPQDSYRYVLTMKRTDGADIMTAEAVNITSDVDGQSAEGLIQRVEALEEALDDYDSGLTDRVVAIEENLELSTQEASTPEKQIVPASWTINAAIDGNGNYSTSGNAATTNAVSNGFIPVSPGAQFLRTAAAVQDGSGNLITTWLHEYAGQTWKRRTYFQPNVAITVGDDCTNIQFSIGRNSSTGIRMTQEDVDTYFGVKQLAQAAKAKTKTKVDRIEANTLREKLLSAVSCARSVVAKRMRLLTDIEWTALAPAPRFLVQGSTWTKTQWPAGTKITGIPYAAQLRYEQWAGRNITFETFLSAAANPNSVIYDFTRQQDSTLYHPGCWYSIVCSKAALFGIGVDANYASGYLANDPHISKVANAGAYTAEDIRIGDIIEKQGEHTAIVTDKIYSTFGRLVQIEVSEAVTPSCRRIRWNLEGNVRNFWDHWGDYYLLRYDNIENVPGVDPESLIPYISETLGLNFGNKANYMTEDTAKVTILNPVGNSLIVTRDGTVVETIDVRGMEIGEEITITSSTPGFYSINFEGGEVKDAVEFLRDDSTCSYSGGVLTFSSTNGKLVRVAFAASGFRSHVGTDVVPSDENREAGQITVTKPSSAAFIHAFFETQYGVLCREIAC